MPVSNSHALVQCYELEAQAELYIIGAEATCESLDGGGGKFSSSLITSVTTCTDYSGVIHSDGIFYQVNVGCNTCTAANLVDELNANKETCIAEGREPGLRCMFTTWDWGSHLTTLGNNQCGSTISSSSTEELSSSSGECLPGEPNCGTSSSSSGSPGSSSSSTGSGGTSSGGNGGDKGTTECFRDDTKKVTDCVDECLNGGYGCWKRNISSSKDTTYQYTCPRMADPTTSLPPSSIEVSENIYGCDAYFYLKIPIVHILSTYNVCFADSTGSVHFLYHEYYCQTGPKAWEYARPTRKSPGVYECNTPIANITFAAFDLDPATTSSFGSPSVATQALYFFEKNSNEYFYACGESSCHAPSNVNSDYATQAVNAYTQRTYGQSALDYVLSRIRPDCLPVSSSSFVESSSSSIDEGAESSSSSDFGSYSSSLGEIDWGSSSSAQDPGLSSSDDGGENDSSSSSANDAPYCARHPLPAVPSDPNTACFEKDGVCYQCDSSLPWVNCSFDWLWIYEFNASNIGSWYKEVPCFGDGFSSSSVVSSSSVSEQPGSSSSGSQNSSSGSIVPSSSSSTLSGTGTCPEHPFRSVPGNPSRACFGKNGKCYRCNPDRGNECGQEWLWIYDFLPGNVGWWYQEVPCFPDEPSGSSSSVNSSSSGTGICPAHPLPVVPFYPLDACFNKNGKCYKCNPERKGECGNSWLWVDPFVPDNVGWWYKEIACDGGAYCPEEAYANSVLRKSFDGFFDNNTAREFNEFEFQPAPIRYYDALGRRTVQRSEIVRPLFWKKNKNVSSYQGQSSLNDLSKNYPVMVGFDADSVEFSVEGHALAIHKIKIKYNVFEQSKLEELHFCKCRPGGSIPFTMDLYLYMTTTINEVIDEGNPLLAAHEQWHVDSYERDGTFGLTPSIQVDYCDQKTICQAIANEAKSAFEPRFRALLEAQNTWDDEDPNNSSKERIPVDAMIEGMYREVDFELKDCINWVYEQKGQ